MIQGFFVVIVSKKNVSTASDTKVLTPANKIKIRLKKIYNIFYFFPFLPVEHFAIIAIVGKIANNS